MPRPMRNPPKPTAATNIIMNSNIAAKARHESPEMSWKPSSLSLIASAPSARLILLRILQILHSSAIIVSALVEKASSTQPDVSKHLKVPEDLGLVKRRQVETSAY